jgi:hypothetical protein
MESRNQMSLQTLCQKEGTTNLENYDFVGKDNKKHCFFALGSKKVIWASDRAKAEILKGQTALANGDVQTAKTCFMNIQFAECKKEGLPDTNSQGRSNWVPSLMIAGNKPTSTIQLTF